MSNIDTYAWYEPRLDVYYIRISTDSSNEGKKRGLKFAISRELMDEINTEDDFKVKTPTSVEIDNNFEKKPIPLPTRWAKLIVEQ